jgi:hypothetical protein
MVVIGLGITFASVSELARRDVHPAALTWMVICGLGMIMGVTALVLRQWTNLAGVAKEKERTFPRKKPVVLESAPAQLPPLRSEPITSVTDHTTRTFDPVYREPVERRK